MSSVITTGGVPTSTITGTINKTTMSNAASVPYSGEVGDDSKLAYALQIDQHVRMDLFYGRLAARKRAVTDAITILFVIFYLCVLFGGAVSSTNYAIVYHQKNYTAWGPPLWPIKSVMTAGIFLMLLQLISTFIKDVAIARGKPIA